MHFYLIFLFLKIKSRINHVTHGGTRGEQGRDKKEEKKEGAMRYFSYRDLSGKRNKKIYKRSNLDIITFKNICQECV